MMDKCFNEGTIQAFLDGELASEIVENLTSHIALCDDCAIAVAEAEQESAYAFAALETELDTLVPTQRLWTKINDSIESEANERTVWQAITDFLTTPMAAGFASILIVFGVGFGLVKYIDNQTGDFASLDTEDYMEVYNPFQDVVIVEPASLPKEDFASNDEGNDINEAPRQITVVAKDNRKPTLTKAKYTPTRRVRSGNGNGRNIQTIAKTNEPEQNQNEAVEQNPLAPPVTYLPGEETYVRTIAALEEKVDEKKDYVMNASTRFSYEKDLALANDTISKMRQEVEKNPGNTGAREVLRSAYQNKIDLLNAVSEKTELLASLD